MAVHKSEKSLFRLVGGAAKNLDWLSDESQTFPVLDWTECAQRDFDPLFVVPPDIGVQHADELLDRGGSPIPRIKQLVLQSSKEALAYRVIRRAPLAGHRTNQPRVSGTRDPAWPTVDVRTIEHGNLIDEPTAKLMAEHGAFVVPTLVAYEALHGEGVKYGLPAESAAKLETVRAAGLQSLEIFKRAGVKMGFGSDLLGPSHRLQSDEFTLRAQVLAPAEIISSATTIGAEVLGMTGKLGRLAAGAFADLLIVDGNPLKDLNCLTGQGEHIHVVMKGGKVEFGTLH